MLMRNDNLKNNVPNDEFLRKRALRQKKIRKRRLKIFFVFFIVLSLCVTATLCLTVFFPIEKLDSYGSKLYTKSEILEASDIEKGDNLFAVPKSKIEQRLKKKLPYIDKIELERKLPDTLKVKVTDAEEYSAYYIKKKYYTVSESGWVLKATNKKPENIFTVFGAKAKCKVGSSIEFSDAELKELALNLTKVLNQSKIKINSIDISDTLSIVLQVEDRFDVKLGTANYLEEKIRHLSGMVEKIDENQTGEINLSMWTNDNSQGTFTPIIRQ